MPLTQNDLKLVADSLRFLSIDAVQKAKSGHPGMPMGAADIATLLWTKHLKFNPQDPNWMNRDRFILSAGHASMLLYSLMHFAGYDITLDDIKQFRQWGSKTPGHPEYWHVPGIETTTGPLGQGFANAVGMAYARDMLAKEFNDTDNSLIDHFIYVLTSDGDLMEGISYEAASLAGHLGLGKLIYIYDSNRVCIDGCTDLSFSDDIVKRFESFHWHVQEIDGHDLNAIDKAIERAKSNTKQPSIIIAHTEIGKGCITKEGSAVCHGSPLGDDEIKNTKNKFGWDPEKSFHVPEQVYKIFNDIVLQHQKTYTEWQSKFKKEISGEKHIRWNNFFSKPDINKLRESIPAFDPAKKIATRESNHAVLTSLFKTMPNLIGGSADLGDSNKVYVKGISESGMRETGRTIHFGIREHAMGAIVNGISYYGGFIPYSATFLVFKDYMVPPMRLAALSKIPSIFVFTHDSFFVGEDGPTHQPIEHLASARMIPNLHVIRPADADETREAWLSAVSRTDGPTMLIFTRQNLPLLPHDTTSNTALNLHRGAYVAYETAGDNDIIILASGSEVHISIEAAKELEKTGKKCRVVSIPCWEIFEKQDDDYRESILQKNITRRVVVEAGTRFGWERYAGCEAVYITRDEFGRSAPAEILAEKFGFTAENIVKQINNKFYK